MQLRCPALFCTLSPADYHWADLHRHMPRAVDWLRAGPSERIKISREHVRDNPHITAWHFYYRFKYFKEEVLVKKFNVVDFWDRFEWQARGSTHSHGLYYIKDAPDPDRFLANLDNIDVISRFTDYWGIHISAMHPQPIPTQILDERSILSLSFDDMKWTFGELSEIMTRCHIHRCMPVYCLMWHKKDKKMVCRFNAPWPAPVDSPSLTQVPGKSYYQFEPVRNHARLGPYNRTIALGWRANTNVQPCTSLDGVVAYTGKYASKWETTSGSYKDLADKLMGSLNPDKPMHSFMQKLMNKLVGERNWSSQEINHIMFGLPLLHCSRQFVDLDCRPDDDKLDAYHFQAGDSEDGLKRGKSILDKYIERPQLEGVSLYVFLLNFTHRKPFKARPRAKDRIVSYFPRYKARLDPENFARVKLMLHHPFRRVEDVLQIDDQIFLTYFDAYEHCKEFCIHDRDDAYRGDALPDEEVDPDLEAVEADDEDIAMSWDELAARRPGTQGIAIDDETLESGWLTGLWIGLPILTLTIWMEVPTGSK